MKSNIAISKGAGVVPSIVWTGDQFAVAWSSYEKDKGGDIHVALVERDGTKTFEGVVSEGPAASKLPHITRLASGEFLVLWYDVDGTGSVAMGRYLTAAGAGKGNAFQLATSKNKEARPNAAAGSGGLIAAWMDAPGSFLGALGGSAVSSTLPIEPAGYPVVAASADASAAVWIDGNRLGFAHLTTPLGPMAPTWFREGAAHVNVPRLTGAGNGTFAVAWEDGADDNATIYTTRIGADGKAGAEVLVPTEGGSANYPDVVVVGDRTLVSYYQFRDGPPAIFLARVAADGEVESDEEISVGAAKYPRMAVSDEGIGLVYSEVDGPVKMALVQCAD